MAHKKYKTGITFGTYDLFHIGHVNILKRAKTLCDRLVVGVSSDALNFNKKQVLPLYNEMDRIAIVHAIEYVDDVFLEESLEEKIAYIQKYQAEVLIMGSDWEFKFDFCKDFCDVIYFPRTEGISTSQLIGDVKNS